MTEGTYLTDAYLDTFSTQVREIRGKAALLESTAFYPGGGGQPSDRGTLGVGDRKWTVSEVSKSVDGILHELLESEPPAVGSIVTGRVDWPRRYAHMRYHTALHILSGAVHRRFGSGITGGQISAERARMDFSLPEFGPSIANELLEEVNAVVAQDLPVLVRFIPRGEFDRRPELVRVAPALMPEVSEVRLIDISGFDVQADGGTHVASTSEVGPAHLERIENKGARNKRLYLALGEAPKTRPPHGPG